VVNFWTIRGNWLAIDRPIIASRSVDVQSSEQVSAREMIGPVNSPLTGQSTCLFKRFALILGEVTIGRSTVKHADCLSKPFGTIDFA